MASLKHNTAIEVRKGGFGFAETYEPARINARAPKAWGVLPDGWHRVTYADGGCMSVHESGFRVIENQTNMPFGVA